MTSPVLADRKRITSEARYSRQRNHSRARLREADAAVEVLAPCPLDEHHAPAEVIAGKVKPLDVMGVEPKCALRVELAPMAMG